MDKDKSILEKFTDAVKDIASEHGDGSRKPGAEGG